MTENTNRAAVVGRTGEYVTVAFWSGSEIVRRQVVVADEQTPPAAAVRAAHELWSMNDSAAVLWALESDQFPDVCTITESVERTEPLSTFNDLIRSTFG